MASGDSVMEESQFSTQVAEIAEGYSDPDRLNRTTMTTKDDHPKEVVIGVDLLSVVVSFAVLLTLSSVGTVSNVMVLAVIKYRKSFRAAVRRDAVLANLSIVHLILCFVLSPIEFATLAENYVKHSLPGFLCLARDCGFHLLVGANVIGVIILAVCQARRLQRASPATRSTGGWGDALPVLQLALPWIAGACAAGSSVAIRLVTGLGFEVCRKSIAFWEEVQRGADPWQLQLLPGLVYFLLLLGALVWLLTVVERNRKYAAMVRKYTDRDRKQSETAEDSSHRGSTDKRQRAEEVGVELIGREKSPTSDKAERFKGRGGAEKGGGEGRRGEGGRSETRAHQKPTEEAQETDDCEEDDDDTFDIKMRHEFQKKSRSSGRRHTVANIGLPDLSDLRSSTDAQPTYASKTTEYHYVRKWSVDITALANQLENPKSHSDTSPFKEKEELGYEETFKGLRTPSSNACVVTSCEYLGPKSAATGNDGARRRQSSELRTFHNDPKKLPKGKRETKEKDKSEQRLSPRRTQTSITAPSEETEGEGRMESGEESTARLEGAAGITMKTVVSSSDEPPQLQQRDIIDDDRAVAKARRELTTTTRMSAALLVSLVFTLPCLVIFLWLVFAPIGNLHIGYNLSIAAEIVVTLQAAVNPVVLLFWVDRRLHRRLRNLVRDATHLRCVCYCNIGRHSNCLQPYKGGSAAASYRQAPVDGVRMQKV